MNKARVIFNAYGRVNVILIVASIALFVLLVYWRLWMSSPINTVAYTGQQHGYETEAEWILNKYGTISSRKSEDAGHVDKNLSSAAKHSRLKDLLNPISIAGGLDIPLVEVEYKGRQSNVILTTQEESTLKIFGNWRASSS
jgi:hypothetical protein